MPVAFKKMSESADGKTIGFFGADLPVDAFAFLSSIVDDAFSTGDKKSLLTLSSFFVNAGLQKRADYFARIAEGNDVGNIYRYLYSEEKKAEKPQTVFTSSFDEEKDHLQITVSALQERIEEDQTHIIDPGKLVYSGDEDETNAWRSRNEENGRRQKEIKECEALKERPYFARVDVRNSKGIVETHYIGDSLYVDFRHGDIVIESPWSDYRDLYSHKQVLDAEISGEKYHVTLKRKIEIYQSALQDVKDLYLEQGTSRGDDQEEDSAPVTDPFLLHVLEEKRGEPQVTNIIRSIQAEQNEIIEAPLNTNLLVQGCAGSGKTMILLHRLSYLCYRNKNLQQNRICVVGPSTNYDAFFDGLASELKIEDVHRTTMNGLLYSLYRMYWDLYGLGTTSITEEKWLSETVLNKEDKELAKAIYSPSFRATLKEECTEYKKEKDSRSDDIDLAIAAMKEDHPYGYRNDPRYFDLLKAKSERAKNNQDVFTENREFGVDFIRRVLKRPSLSKGGKFISAVRYAQILFLLDMFGPIETSVFDLFSFDEAQDYPYCYWLLLHEALGPRAICNFYGDLNQGISSDSAQSWNGVANLFACQRYTLENNYRNSEEIIHFYNAALNTTDRAMGLKTQNVIPVDKLVLGLYLKLSLLFKNRTAVISNNPSFLRCFLTPYATLGRIESGKIALLSVSEAKGLEFDAVFVYPKGLSANGKYIAMTRALSELYIVVLGE